MKASFKITALVFGILFAVCFLLGIFVCRERNIVYLEIEGEGTVIAELYPDAAPRTVRNFKSHVRRGTYDGVIFHRIIEDFVVQTGDPNGDGIGGAGKEILGEFSENGFANPIAHRTGVLSMARTNLPNSASSQFFICLSNNANVKNLDGKYAAFGQVISGMEHISAIGLVPTNANDRPLAPPVLSDARLARGENAPISGFGIFLIVLGSICLFVALIAFFAGLSNARKRHAAAKNIRNKKKQRMTQRQQ